MALFGRGRTGGARMVRVVALVVALALLTRLAVAQDAPVPPAGQTELAVSFAGSGDNTVVSATALQTVKVYRLLLVCASAVAVTIKDGAGTSLTGAMTLGALVLDQQPIATPWFTTASGNAFVVNLGSAVQCSGKVSYVKS